MRIDILRLLFSADSYVSGEEISGKLNISRAAVWKNIKEIKDDGGEVEAQTNRGYKLLKLPDLLKAEYLCLYVQKPPDMVKWHKETDSTNDRAKALAREGAPHGTLVVAEHQTGGKGRLGRAWDSQQGEAIQMSLVLRPGLAPSRAPALNLAAALGVCGAIKDVCGVEAGIKWPNDVVYQGKKLCGILIEMSSDMDRIEYAVLGAGLNVNQQRFDGEIAQRAVSLAMITKKRLNRLVLCASMAECIEDRVDTYIKGGMAAIEEEYGRLSAILGREVNVVRAGEGFTGVCAGFGENGEIIVRNGAVERRFHAGEVSLRGVNDYV